MKTYAIFIKTIKGAVTDFRQMADSAAEAAFIAGQFLGSTAVQRVIVLEHGKEYDLGATMARYNADEDSFQMGNCFVPRWDTIYFLR